MKPCSAVKLLPLILVLMFALPAWGQQITVSSQPAAYCPTSTDVALGAITLQVNANGTTVPGSSIALAPDNFTAFAASTSPVLSVKPGANPNITITYSPGQPILIRFNAAISLTSANSFTVTGLTVDATQLPSGTNIAMSAFASNGSSFTFSGLGSSIVGRPDSTVCPATLTASPTSLTFRAAPGGGVVIAPQIVTLTSASGQNIALPTATVSTDLPGSWLSAAIGTVSSNTYNINISVDPSGLALGKYTGKVTLTVANTVNSPLEIPVTLFIFDGPLVVSQNTVFFRTSTGVNPPSQQIVLRTSDPAVPLPTLTTIQVQSPTGGTWLKATTATGVDTTANNQPILTVTISPQPGTLAPSGGLAYQGFLIFSSDLANPPTSNVLVQLQVDAQAPQIALTRTAVGFAAAANSNSTVPTQQGITISNTGGGTLSWSTAVSTDTGGSWLSVTPSSGTGSVTVSITASPLTLSKGTYTGAVTFTAPSASNSPQKVAVTLAVGAVPLALSAQYIPFCPTSTDAALADLTLTSVSGGPVSAGSTITISLPSPLSATAAPKLVTTPSVANVSLTVASQLLTLTFGGGVTLPENFQMQISGLRVDGSRITGTQAVATVAVSADSPFLLSNVPTILLANADANSCPARITLSPSTLSFTVPAGSTSASSQTFLVGNLGGGTFNWTATPSTDNGGTWLSVNPANGTGNVVITVLVNPTGLAAGAYTGAINIASVNASNSPQKVAVTLSVGNAPAIADRGIKNSASFSDGQVSANSFLSVFGTNLTDSSSPVSAPAFQFPLPTTLGNSQVKVNGTAAPLFFVSQQQINFLLPSDATGSAVSILVSRNNSDGAPVSVPLVPAVPGVFTKNSQGTGEGIILKPDFSLISASNPAAPGSVIIIFGAAMGPTNPRVPSGFASPTDPVAACVTTPTVSIGGLTAPVGFCGLTPGLSGLYQINVTVPPTVTRGLTVPVSVTVGGVSSNQITVAVQ